MPGVLNATGISGIIDLAVYPFGNSYYSTDACGNGPYSSDERHCWAKRCVKEVGASVPADCFAGDIVAQHGDTEKAINMIEACAIKLNPSWKTYWPFFQCMEEKYDVWAVEACASRASIDSKAINECANGPTGNAAEVSIAKVTPDHPGVPYILVNGKALGDPRVLLKAICDAYAGPKPAGCSHIRTNLTNEEVAILV